MIWGVQGLQSEKLYECLLFLHVLSLFSLSTCALHSRERCERPSLTSLVLLSISLLYCSSWCLQSWLQQTCCRGMVANDSPGPLNWSNMVSISCRLNVIAGIRSDCSCMNLASSSNSCRIHLKCWMANAILNAQRMGVFLCVALCWVRTRSTGFGSEYIFISDWSWWKSLCFLKDSWWHFV